MVELVTDQMTGGKIMHPLDRFGFEISDEQKQIYDAMLRFGLEHLQSGAQERDRSHSFPSAQAKALADMGGFAMKAGSEDDGPALDNLSYLLTIEALSRYDASLGVVAVAGNLAASILSKAANKSQRESYLRPLARGEKGAMSFALTEPHCGSDAAAMKTTARKSGKGWVLSGSKQWITGATDAELFLVFAKTPEEGDGGYSAFVVERGQAGFSLGRAEDKMGLRSSGTAQLFFESCELPDEALVGAVGQGFRYALSGIAASRLAIAAQSIGIAERALELGLAYARERQAFGQAVVQFQNSQFVFADCRCALDQAWLLMLRGAKLLDKGVGDIRAEASMAKLAASEMCGRVVDQMVQMHGGNGYSQDFEIERLYRDARVMRIFEGTSEVQREVIAREILKA